MEIGNKVKGSVYKDLIALWNRVWDDTDELVSRQAVFIPVDNSIWDWMDFRIELIRSVKWL